MSRVLASTTKGLDNFLLWRNLTNGLEGFINRQVLIQGELSRHETCEYPGS